MSRAFTLIELLVVVSIIVLMTALTLPNYRSGNNQLALQRSIHKMAQDLRMAQEYAISAKEFNGAVPAGYGAYFDLDQPNSYIIFADLIPADQEYSGINEKVEEINLETNIILTDLVPVTPQKSLTIIFVPPNPTIVFKPDASLSAMTIGVKGTEHQVTQYYYQREFDWSDILSPNPPSGCDVNPDSLCCIGGVGCECPGTIPTSATAPPNVYDRCKFMGEPLSNYYSKQQNQAVILTSKTIQVNKAGLIAIE